MNKASVWDYSHTNACFFGELCICVPANVDLVFLYVFFFWVPICSRRVLQQLQSASRPLAHTHSHLKALCRTSVSTGQISSPAWLQSLQNTHIHTQHTDRPAIRLVPVVSLPITNSQVCHPLLLHSAHLPLFLFSVAGKNQSNSLHQVTACNNDTSYGHNFHYHLRPNSYLTYQMTRRKKVHTTAVCAPICVCVCILTVFMHACCRRWVASSGYESCPVLLCSGPDMD